MRRRSGADWPTKELGSAEKLRLKNKKTMRCAKLTYLFRGKAKVDTAVRESNEEAGTGHSRYDRCTSGHAWLAV